MSSRKVQERNARFHIIEGALYISTNALIPAQTMMPALIKRLGGSDVIVGAWPVVAYLAFYLPQLISANYSSASQYRKPIVIGRGFIQRMHIILIAFVLALFGITAPKIALFLLFALYISNQITAGSVSPIWMDFLAKTTSPTERGKLAGIRTSLAAILGLINGIILTALFAMLSFPYNYASAIAVAFIYQLSSLIAQRKIIEDVPSIISAPFRFDELFKHLKLLIINNQVYRKFLIASSFTTISFSSVAFFTVAAMERFTLSESIVGMFTVMTFIGQIISGVIVGWIADDRGTKAALIICGTSLFLSILFALLAPSVIWFYFAFVFFGINIGTEMFMRYNFAVECSPEGNRPMYVGLMNAWLAPFYIAAPLAGWLSGLYGYNLIFIISLLFGLTGIILLIRMPDACAMKTQNIKP